MKKKKKKITRCVCEKQMPPVMSFEPQQLHIYQRYLHTKHKSCLSRNVKDIMTFLSLLHNDFSPFPQGH